MLLHQIGGDKMYIDPLKNVRGVLNERISSLQSAVDIAMKPTRETLCSIKQTGIYNQLQLFESMNNDWNRTFMNLKLETVNNALLFNKNLFSNKVLNDFIESTTISKNEVLKMSNALRNFSVDVVSTSAFTEPVNSSHPVNIEQDESDNNRSNWMFYVNHIYTSSSNFITVINGGISGGAALDFLSRLAYGQPINGPFYIWVLFFTYFFHLLTNKPEE